MPPLTMEHNYPGITWTLQERAVAPSAVSRMGVSFITLSAPVRPVVVAVAAAAVVVMATAAAVVMVEVVVVVAVAVVMLLLRSSGLDPLRGRKNQKALPSKRGELRQVQLEKASWTMKTAFEDQSWSSISNCSFSPFSNRSERIAVDPAQWFHFQPTQMAH